MLSSLCSSRDGCVPCGFVAARGCSHGTFVSHDNCSSLCSPSGYSSTLSKLLQLAPEPDKGNPLQIGKGQSILVTHFVDGRKLVRQDDDDSLFRPDDSGDSLDDLFHAANGPRERIDASAAAAAAAVVEDDEDDAKAGSSAVPWPSNHSEFLRSESTASLLCLEIASGSAVNHPAAWISSKHDTSARKGTSSIGRNSRGPVLLPGSLRERGEFSILTLALVEQPAKTQGEQQRRFAWGVQSVDFHHLNNFG